MSNMTHFDNSHSVWNKRKMPFFKVWVSPALMQNAGIWNFHESMTLNNGKQIWYDIHEHAAFMDVLAFFWSGFLCSLSHHMLDCQLM